jgi:hypothetical protein
VVATSSSNSGLPGAERALPQAAVERGRRPRRVAEPNRHGGVAPKVGREDRDGRKGGDRRGRLAERLEFRGSQSR